MMEFKFGKIVTLIRKGVRESWLPGLAAGLYPILFYFTNNYTLVNTWGHVRYFALFFLLLPLLIILFFELLTRWKLKRFHSYVVPFFNVFIFLFLLKVCLFGGPQKKLILLILVISSLFAWYARAHFKKLVVFQLLLAVIGIFTLAPKIIKQLNFSKEWMLQPDAIVEVTFKKKPNIYVIQPDGYPNFSELDKGYYALDNSTFENFLTEKGFENYPDFRSNYATTLTSNSATFSMKHHYYIKSRSFGEMMSARDIIVSENPVLTAFKNNQYKTHLILEKPYLLANRPKMGYDYCNYDYDEVKYVGTALTDPRDVEGELDSLMQLANDAPKFYFVEFFNPGHIANRKGDTQGKEKEREKWMTSLDKANNRLKRLTNNILDKDPGALIVIMADHGGSVGYDYTREIYHKQTDRDLIYSTFSSQLSIHWPEPIVFETKPKSPVNVFRFVISYLAEDQQYLQHLQEDASFVIINRGAPKGIYKCIDSAGEIVFEKLN